MHVQMVKGQAPEAAMERDLLARWPPSARPARLVLWPVRRFSVRYGSDYERKFSHYVPGEREP